MAQAHNPVTTAIHEAEVDAPAKAVYEMLADLDGWPRIFRPFVHVESLGTADGFERVGMWTASDDRVEHWTALRRLDGTALRIDFRPERPAAPLASMERSWSVRPLSARTCAVRLTHAYRVLGDDPAALRSARELIDVIADAETAAVKAAAEQEVTAPELVLVVTDTVDVTAAPEAVYEALHDVRRWPGFLPHVERVELKQDTDGMQMVEMDTRESDGGVLTLRTARVGLRPRAVVYKQLLLPPIGRSHHVRWHLGPSGAGGGTTVTSEQVVVLDPAGVSRMLGEGTGVEEARAFVQRELSAKVRLLLEGMKAHVEAG